MIWLFDDDGSVYTVIGSWGNDMIIRWSTHYLLSECKSTQALGASVIVN